MFCPLTFSAYFSGLDPIERKPFWASLFELRLDVNAVKYVNTQHVNGSHNSMSISISNSDMISLHSDDFSKMMLSRSVSTCCESKIRPKMFDTVLYNVKCEIICFFFSPLPADFPSTYEQHYGSKDVLQRGLPWCLSTRMLENIVVDFLIFFELSQTSNTYLVIWNHATHIQNISQAKVWNKWKSCKGWNWINARHAKVDSSLLLGVEKNLVWENFLPPLKFQD